jgi:hypothetical protein
VLTIIKKKNKIEIYNFASLGIGINVQDSAFSIPAAALKNKKKKKKRNHITHNTINIQFRKRKIHYELNDMDSIKYTKTPLGNQGSTRMVI